jgi:hypothetical protein
VGGFQILPVGQDTNTVRKTFNAESFAFKPESPPDRTGRADIIIEDSTMKE